MASRTAVLDRVERLLRAGLTAKAFRERVLAELRPVLPHDGHVWLLTDPLTRVGTSPLADVPALDLRDLPNLGRLRYLTTVNRRGVLVAEGRHAATLLGETGDEPERSLLWRECLSGLAHGLTPREREVLVEVARGLDSRAVAERLVVSEHTVHDHVKAVLAKTGTATRQALLARIAGAA